MKDNKISLYDWRFKLGILFLILAFIFLIISLILFTTAKFVDNFHNFLGNGFSILNHNSLKDLLFHWEKLDDQAIHSVYLNHDFLQVFIAIIFLLFLLPVFFTLAIILILRWWIKTRI